MKTLTLLFALLTGPLAQAATCPTSVVLEGPGTSAGPGFPDDAQLAAMFQATFRDLHDEPTFEASDLSLAQSFMRGLAGRFGADGALTLRPHAAANGQCAGDAGGLAFTIGDDSVIFNLDDFRNSVEIFFGTPGGAAYFLGLPSNCSNCPREANLMTFRRVSRLP